MEMKKLRLTLLSFLIISLIISGCSSSGKKNNQSSNTSFGSITNDGIADCYSGNLLVKFKPGTDPEQLLKEIDGQILQYNATLDYYNIRYFARLNLSEAKQTLKRTGKVDFAESNYVVKAFVTPMDNYLSKQWGLVNIKAFKGWDSAQGSPDVKIAIIDTGIDHTHVDLGAKVVNGCRYLNGYLISGFPGDDNGHGTHVAGIAAGIANNGGIAGVAWNCKLLAVKVLDRYGGGSMFDIAQGIIWAVDNGADVINLSLGGSGYTRYLHDAVDYALRKNVIVVAAAGNSSRLDDNLFPANFPGVITVGATKPDDTKAIFSTETNNLTLAAPGEEIFSTMPGGRYAYLSGTSMAAPFVTGAAALVKSKWSDMGVNEVRTQLIRTATGNGTWNQQTGWGILNLETALDEKKTNEFGSLEILVYDDSSNPIAGASILLTGNGGTVGNVVTGNDGKAYFCSLMSGSYSVIAQKYGYRDSGSAEITPGATSLLSLTINVPPPILRDDAESDPPTGISLADTQWTKVPGDCFSAINGHCWTDSPAGNYADNSNLALTTISFSLVGTNNPYLTFYHILRTGDGDMGRIEISINGGEWQLVSGFGGYWMEWMKETIPLSYFKTESNVRIRFRMSSDGVGNDDGWYIDNIEIRDSLD